MSRYGIVYGLYDPRGGCLRYIGQTTRPLKVRLRSHLNKGNLRENRHSSHWLSELCANGLHPLALELGWASSREDLDALEVHLITEARQRGEHLTNHADGGGGRSGATHTAETKAKMSAAAKKGVPRSTETKAKISVANKGRVRSPAFRAAVSARSTGKQHCLGKKATPETRAKLSAAHKGLLAGPKHPQYRSDLSTDLILQRLQEGASRKQVAEELGTTQRFIGKRLQQAERAGAVGVPKPKSRVPIDVVLGMYSAGLSVSQIAKETGLARVTVYLKLRQAKE